MDAEQRYCIELGVHVALDEAQPSLPQDALRRAGELAVDVALLALDELTQEQAIEAHRRAHRWARELDRFIASPQHYRPQVSPAPRPTASPGSGR